MERGKASASDYSNGSATFVATAESMIAVDSAKSNHLVGVSQFIHNLDDHYRRFSSYDGAEVSMDGGTSWRDQIVPGFDCRQREAATNQTIYRTTDPVVAFDSSGKLYGVILPVYRIGNEEHVATLYATKSTDGGVSWTIAYGGKPIFNQADSPDKPWVIVDNSPTGPYRGTVYVVWTASYGKNGEQSAILMSKSMDSGLTFTAPVDISPRTANITYQLASPALEPDGTMYVNFIRTCFPCADFDELVAKSSDGGRSFGAPVRVGTFPYYIYTNSQFRVGIPESFTINPTNGHLLLAVEKGTKMVPNVFVKIGKIQIPVSDRTDILLYESSDGGVTWNSPLTVNDNNADANMIQPVIAASPNGVEAVAFYDRRLSCPNEPWILPADVDRANLCLDTSIQFFSDHGALKVIGTNIRVTNSSWDPENSGSLAPTQIPLHFIGDYFGLTVTNSTAYVFYLANYNLGANPAYDTQSFLGRIKLTLIFGNTPILNPNLAYGLAVTVLVVVIVACVYGFRRRLKVKA